MTERGSLEINDNQEWLLALAAGSPRQEQALAQLRVFLLRGLRRAYAGQGRSDDSLLEDAVQETLMKITANLDSFRGASRFTTWAMSMSIAVRTAVSQRRRAHWRDVSLDEMAEEGRIIPSAAEFPGAGEETVALEHLMNVVVCALRDGLTEKQRQTIEAELAGAPTDEIADRMGTNRNAVYKLGYDARARLKKIILEAGWTENQVRQLIGTAQ